MFHTVCVGATKNFIAYIIYRNIQNDPKYGCVYKEERRLYGYIMKYFTNVLYH